MGGCRSGLVEAGAVGDGAVAAGQYKLEPDLAVAVVVEAGKPFEACGELGLFAVAQFLGLGACAAYDVVVALVGEVLEVVLMSSGIDEVGVLAEDLLHALAEAAVAGVAAVLGGAHEAAEKDGDAAQNGEGDVEVFLGHTQGEEVVFPIVVAAVGAIGIDWVVGGHHQVLAFVMVEGVLEGLEEIGLGGSGAALGFAGLVMGMEPPLSVEENEGEVWMGLEGDGAGAAVVRVEGIALCPMLFYEGLFTPDLFPTLFAHHLPVVVAGDHEEAGSGGLDGVELGGEATLHLRLVGVIGGGEAVVVHVVAKEKDSGGGACAVCELAQEGKRGFLIVVGWLATVADEVEGVGRRGGGRCAGGQFLRVADVEDGLAGGEKGA